MKVGSTHLGKDHGTFVIEKTFSLFRFFRQSYFLPLGLYGSYYPILNTMGAMQNVLAKHVNVRLFSALLCN